VELCVALSAAISPTDFVSVDELDVGVAAVLTSDSTTAFGSGFGVMTAGGGGGGSDATGLSTFDSVGEITAFELSLSPEPAVGTPVITASSVPEGVGLEAAGSASLTGAVGLGSDRGNAGAVVLFPVDARDVLFRSTGENPGRTFVEFVLESDGFAVEFFVTFLAGNALPDFGTDLVDADIADLLPP
jgi:hypothetical protein